jgi:hypothetical protein
LDRRFGGANRHIDAVKIIQLVQNKMNTNDSLTRKSPSALAENGSSPFLIEFFMVHAMGFRCMAYRDDHGRWRRAFDNVELAGRIRIVE